MTQTLVDLVEPTPYHRKTNSAELRGLYRKEGEAARRNGARQGLWLAVGAYLLFSVIDATLLPDVAFHVIAARFAIGITVLLVLEIVFHTNTGTEWLDLTCATAIVAGYTGWLAVAITTRYTENLSYFMVFGSTFMLGANLFFRFRFLLSVVTSSVILLAFFVSLYLFPVNMPYRIALGSFYISCFVFTSYVNWKLNRERYNVFLNALEAKIQHGEATERGRALLKLSRTDPLTGLENRRAIDEKLRECWSNWQRHGTGFVALLIDVDFFKRFNDYYGHQEGDRCLVRVADALSVMIGGKGGSIGRYGGEEFIVLAPFEDGQKVAALAEGVRRTVEELAILHSHRRDGVSIVTVSVGASFTRNQAGTKLEKIIHEADRALYLAKASGRNCARLFDPNDPESSDESENIAALLKIALEQKLVSMVYQPIQGLSSGRIEGAEALMRLRMLDGTSVPPSLFIPVAERMGAILELGRWAIRSVCEDLLVDDRVEIASVNVSPIQLKAPGFAASVAAILGETGVAGSRLALEITEGLEMEMHSDVLRCIGDLKLLGVKIWLDDFGTGFAGLSWLRLIDFDTVKIDRSFLHDCDSERGRAMLHDIVSLVRNRGPKILVEGVENEEQLELMHGFRIDQIQGYHVGRPVPLLSFRAGSDEEDCPQEEQPKHLRRSA
jgi:diguanylate cyclase (GGDEF)-like protein